MATDSKPAIVLVHGGWHVPQHYEVLLSRLSHQGFEVHYPILATCDEAIILTASMYDDAQIIRTHVIDLTDRGHEIILLLHSYGGVVGTEAAAGLSQTERAAKDLSGGITHLIYMSGYMLQVGESVASASIPRPVPEPVERDETAGTTFPCESPIQFFYADLEPELAKRMENLLVRMSGRALTDTLTHAAWKFIPTTTCLKTMRDEVLFPEWQDRQIRAVRDVGVEVHVEAFECSHSPFLSMPDAVVDVVVRVAG